MTEPMICPAEDQLLPANLMALIQLAVCALRWLYGLGAFFCICSVVESLPSC